MINTELYWCWSEKAWPLLWLGTEQNLFLYLDLYQMDQLSPAELIVLVSVNLFGQYAFFKIQYFKGFDTRIICVLWCHHLALMHFIFMLLSLLECLHNRFCLKKHIIIFIIVILKHWRNCDEKDKTQINLSAEKYIFTLFQKCIIFHTKKQYCIFKNVNN